MAKMRITDREIQNLEVRARLRRHAKVKKRSWRADERIIGKELLSKILYHVESGITAVYDRHSYGAEKRQALVRWAGRMDEILGRGRESAKVVRIA